MTVVQQRPSRRNLLKLLSLAGGGLAIGGWSRSDAAMAQDRRVLRLWKRLPGLEQTLTGTRSALI
jgi:hypothetical protein